MGRPPVDQHRAADASQPRSGWRPRRTAPRSSRHGADARAHRGGARGAAPFRARRPEHADDRRRRRDDRRGGARRAAALYGHYACSASITRPSARSRIRAPSCRSRRRRCMREQRLYQADWLLRFYGFTVEEIAAGGEAACSISTSIPSSPGRSSTATASRSTSTAPSARCCCACRASARGRSTRSWWRASTRLALDDVARLTRLAAAPPLPRHGRPSPRPSSTARPAQRCRAKPKQLSLFACAPLSSGVAQGPCADFDGFRRPCAARRAAGFAPAAGRLGDRADDGRPARLLRPAPAGDRARRLPAAAHVPAPPDRAAWLPRDPERYALLYRLSGAS